jgi:predicted LPLAT superfamily acyltransferase
MREGRGGQQLEVGEGLGLGVEDRAQSAGEVAAADLSALDPYALAAVLRCPIYLTFGLYLGRGRYGLHCEPFAERVELPRAERAVRVQALAQRYADRLAVYVRRATYCWVNFFSLWS